MIKFTVEITLRESHHLEGRPMWIAEAKIGDRTITNGCLEEHLDMPRRAMERLGISLATEAMAMLRMKGLR